MKPGIVIARSHIYSEALIPNLLENNNTKKEEGLLTTHTIFVEYNTLNNSTLTHFIIKYNTIQYIYIYIYINIIKYLL